MDIIISKHEDRSELIALAISACDEENRIIQSEHPNDEELKTAQDEKVRIYELLDAPDEHVELYHLSGMTFINVFFNEYKLRNIDFDITQSKIGEFVVNCNLVIENPSLGEEILPQQRRFSEYGEEYLNEVQEAKDIFMDILSNTQWGNELISLKIS